MTYESARVYCDPLDAGGNNLLACLAVGLFCILAMALSPAPAKAEGRAYEQVTPVASRGTLVQMQNGALALSEPSGLSYLGKPPGEGAASAPYFSRLLAMRGSDGWEAPVGLDPPINFNHTSTLWQSTLAVSRDGTHALAATNVKLTPDGAEGPDAANLYLEDLRTGTSELVATSSVPGALQLFVNVSNDIKPFLEGTDDLSTIVFSFAIPLLPEATAVAFYRWTRAGGLEIVSRLPDGSVPGSLVRPPETPELAKRWVSADGSRILFGLEDRTLFMRVDDKTIPVSVSAIDGEEKPATAQGIDVDGRYAFFTTEMPMTADTPVGGSPAHLYRDDLEAGALEYIDNTSGAYSVSPQRSTLAVSPDGQSVAYLNEDRNMAIWHQGEAKMLLATLQPFFPIWAAQFSSNGRYLAFSETEFPFGGGSGRTAAEGDVYLYDIATERLSCASCIDGEPANSAFLPLGERVVNNRLPHAVDDYGRLFFTSTAGLLPEDTNGVEDVYVYHAGQLSLITPGEGSYPAFLMDISDDGRDVYFGTDQPLVAQDTNGERDIYDARIGGGFPAQNILPPAPCSGEACQGAAPTPPVAGLIGSESAAGAGRTTRSRHHRCDKKRVGAKGKCAKRKGRKDGQGTKSSTSDRGRY